MSEKVQLTVSGIKNDLNEGLTRPEIGVKYGLSNRDLASVFKHPKLKGLKTKPVPQFVLTDDTEEAIETATPAVEEVETATQEFQKPGPDNDFQENVPVVEVKDEF